MQSIELDSNDVIMKYPFFGGQASSFPENGKIIC